MLLVIVLEFFWINKEWNFVQSINQEYNQRDELSQQVLIYLIIAFIGSFGFAFLRIKKIIKTYKI